MKLRELTVESCSFDNTFGATAVFDVRDIATIRKLQDGVKSFTSWFPCTEDEIYDFLEGEPLCLGRARLIIENKKNKERHQVFVNGDVVTLKVGDRVYTAKPEKGEKFDLEKGLLVCLAKANGYSTSDMLKLVSDAVVQSKKPAKKAKRKK